MKFSDKTKQFIVANFDSSVRKIFLQPNRGLSPSVLRVFLRKIDESIENKEAIIESYIRFIENQDVKALSRYLKNIEERQKNCDKERKAVPFVDDAIKVWNKKKTNNICTLTKDGNIEVKDDVMPKNIDFKDDGDLPEADFT